MQATAPRVAAWAQRCYPTTRSGGDGRNFSPDADLTAAAMARVAASHATHDGNASAPLMRDEHPCQGLPGGMRDQTSARRAVFRPLQHDVYEEVMKASTRSTNWLANQPYLLLSL